MNRKNLPGTHIVFLGQLNTEYIITPTGVAKNGVLGGDALYAACGARLWTDGIGILAKVGENFPIEELGPFSEHGIMSDGVAISSKYIEDKRFFSYSRSLHAITHSPATHYINAKLDFPKELLSLSLENSLDAPTPKTKQPDPLRLSDVPENYLYAKGLYNAGPTLDEQLQLSTYFNHANASILTCRLTDASLEGVDTDRLQQLLHHQTILFTNSQQLRKLWWFTHLDVWQLAARFLDLGCEIIILESGKEGYLILERSTQQKWVIPRYPNKPADPTGMAAAFDGGATAGYYLTMDPVESAIFGAVSASICADGSGAFYMLQSHPELANTRLRNLRGKIRKYKG